MTVKNVPGFAQDGWQPPRTAEMPQPTFKGGYQPPKGTQPGQVENPPPKKR